jgi:hypothetical protein
LQFQARLILASKAETYPVGAHNFALVFGRLLTLSASILQACKTGAYAVLLTGTILTKHVRRYRCNNFCDRNDEEEEFCDIDTCLHSSQTYSDMLLAEDSVMPMQLPWNQLLQTSQPT